MTKTINRVEYFYDEEYKKFKVYEDYDDVTAITTITPKGIIMLLNSNPSKLKQYQSLRGNAVGNDDGFWELLGLMNDNNLTWKSVTNIIKEALNESI